MSEIIIKQGKSKPLWYGNPWVFPNSIESIKGNPADGSIVKVLDGRNKSFIGWGFYNSRSFFRVRILSYQESEKIGEAFFESRIKQLLYGRKKFFSTASHNAVRLVNSEGDGLPGFTADLYHNVLILQVNSLGYYPFLDIIKDSFIKECEKILSVKINLILNKVSADEREKEGIEATNPILYGTPVEKIEILQDGLKFEVQLLDMQKTGFYLDQRFNRLFLKNFFQNETKLRVLDAYSYTGAFSCYLARKGFEIDSVDSSAQALSIANKNIENNQLSGIKTTEDDSINFLKNHSGYDLIILDPPKMMKKKEHFQDAVKKYVNIFYNGMLSVKKEGYLAAFSCSGNLGMTDFQNILLESSHQSARKIKILHQSVNSPDHPYHPAVLETGYLKFIFLQVF